MHDGLLISRLIWIYLHATINAYVTIIVYNYSQLYIQYNCISNNIMTKYISGIQSALIARKIFKIDVCWM